SFPLHFQICSQYLIRAFSSGSPFHEIIRRSGVGSPVLFKEAIDMNGVRKILVPINFLEASANGLKYAVSLAEETQAEVLVLHVTQKEQADSFLDLLAVMEG